jgi:poly-gamma-glutamate synthesis protein (capsule biosynthesis protein)
MANRDFLREALAKAYNEDADLTIALPHWGDEYVLKHNETQEEMAVWLSENGADFIIGSHPHVIQDAQMTGSANVAYSLGNAVSNMSARNTQLGLLAKISVVRLHNGDLKFLPIDFTYIWCSRPGGYNESYTVIPVKKFIGKKDRWLGSYDYDKMIDTYRHVKEKTGIKD